VLENHQQQHRCAYKRIRTMSSFRTKLNAVRVLSLQSRMYFMRLRWSNLRRTRAQSDCYRTVTNGYVGVGQGFRCITRPVIKQRAKQRA